ncbi:MAG: NADH-quinone oxidoreductase subunit NuoN [Steroidobacterales bacterium]
MHTATMTWADLWPIYPEAFVLVAACVILLVDLKLPVAYKRLNEMLAILTLVGASWLTTRQPNFEHIAAFGGFFVLDPMAHVLKLFTYALVALAFFYSRDYLERNNLLRGEYYVLGLMAMLGILVMISAGSLLTVYLGVELLALSQYAMVAFNRESGVAAESAMKYFVLGAVASGLLLYGISIVYGVTGSFDLGVLAERVTAGMATNVGLLFGLAFIVVGVAFKFGAVPFHMWIPDVYHGAPTCVTLFISTAPKIASFALAMRVLAEGLGGANVAWQQMLIVLSVLSMAVGNVVAIAQTNLKRMLAYSAISHVGFILLGILAATPEGFRAAMFYTLAYSIMTVGSFGVILLMSDRGFEADNIDDFKGLNDKSPWFALMMLIFMFSTAGVPPFVGFFAKLYVIQAVLHIEMTWLAVAAVLFSVIGAFYYLRIIKVMYFDKAGDENVINANLGFKILLSANAIAVLLLGLFNGRLLDVCILAIKG